MSGATLANYGFLGRPRKGDELFTRDLKLRIKERDEREAADTRTPVERWMGDPPADRSALERSKGPKGPSNRL